MNYSLLKKLSKAELRRTVGGLERLRGQLEAIPAKDSEENLLLATWNIRDLGKPGGGWGYGERLAESYFYIAEVLSRFDFVAVQEVNELWAWEEVMRILGPHWRYVASDVTPAELGGNDERLVYLYDTRKVSFRNVVGEIVLPPSMLVSKHILAKPGDKPKLKKNQLATSGRQFARTPYFASFQAGWRKFDICTVHIYYGAEGGEELERRIEEIRQIATYLADRAKESIENDRALILLGDFNVVGLEHETMKALTDSGFVVPEAIQNPPDGKRNSFYDQIAFMTPKGVLDHVGDGVDDEQESGALPNFESVFTDEKWETYRKHFEPVRETMRRKALAKAREKGRKAPNPTTPEAFYREWRTWQISDHQPLWVRLRADDSNNYLDSLLAPKPD